MVAAIGAGEVFSKGRDFGAWLAVPKQISTGDRTILGKISRRGNRYLRVLFVQAAQVVLARIKHLERYGLKSWIEAAKKRLHPNVLAIALANKLARIAWAVLHKGRAFECVKTNEAHRPESSRRAWACQGVCANARSRCAPARCAGARAERPVAGREDSYGEVARSTRSAHVLSACNA